MRTVIIENMSSFFMVEHKKIIFNLHTVMLVLTSEFMSISIEVFIYKVIDRLQIPDLIKRSQLAIAA